MLSNIINFIELCKAFLEILCLGGHCADYSNLEERFLEVYKELSVLFIKKSLFNH